MFDRSPIKSLHVVYHVRSDVTFAPTGQYLSTPPSSIDIMIIDNAQIQAHQESPLSPRKHSNLIIGQSGGATAVINASLVGAFETALADERIDGIYGMLYGIQGLLKEGIIDLRAEASHVWPQLLSTPSAALGTCRYKLQDDDPGRIIEILRRYDMRYLLYIGG